MIVFVIYLIKLYESGIFTLQISIYAVKKPVDIERGDKLPCFYSLFVCNCCMLFVCAFLFVPFFSPYFSLFLLHWGLYFGFIFLHFFCTCVYFCFPMCLPFLFLYLCVLLCLCLPLVQVGTQSGHVGLIPAWSTPPTPILLLTHAQCSTDTNISCIYLHKNTNTYHKAYKSLPSPKNTHPVQCGLVCMCECVVEL